MSELHGAGSVLLRTALHFALTALPCLAAGAFALRKGLRDTVLVGLVGLAAIGGTGYLAFWVWFISPKAGHLFSLLLPIGAAAWLGVSYRKLDSPRREVLKRLCIPLALTGLAALVILSTGFAYGGVETPLRTAAERFSHPLPGDNAIPYLFSEGIRAGHVPRPLIAEWLSSDRPPLQTGCVLAQYTYLTQPRDLGYSVLGAILESLWIFAAWLLLTAVRLDVKASILALTGCLFSGFVFLNTFYVWPKLLAAAYSVTFLIPLLAPDFAVAQRMKQFPVLLGALVAFAALAHGSGAFAIIGAGGTALILRRRVRLRSLVSFVVTVFCLYLPWLLYQKLCDPPGDYLLKMHLAGAQAVDTHSFIHDLISAYRGLTIRQIISKKVSNFAVQVQYFGDYWHAVFDFFREITHYSVEMQTALSLRSIMFYVFGDNLAFFALGPLALLGGFKARYRTREWKMALTAWIYIAVTVSLWCTAMFRSASTIIHAGAYVVILLAYVASVLAFWAIAPVIAVIITALQIVLNVLLYAIFMGPPRAVVSTSSWQGPWIALCTMSLVGLIAVLWRMSTSRDALLRCGDGQAAVDVTGESTL